MSKTGRDIVVIGTSAGGLETLDQLTGQLPEGFSAAIFIVQHLHPEHTPQALLHKLSRHKTFHCKIAEDGEAFERGKIYLAPSDAHLLIKETTLLVRRGARENRYRPAVDPLFRSAAVAHGPRVIGVVLTGMLDDGTSGLVAIHRCGGVTVVQDPSDALYPDMPRSALNNDHVNYCVPVAEMGRLLDKLSREIPEKAVPIPDDVRIEAEIAERVLLGIEEMRGLGTQVLYTCPSCGGSLWEMKDPDGERYRCHTGHTFTAAALSNDQSKKIEETLWIALRMFEERKNLSKNMAHKQDSPRMKQMYEQNAQEAEKHIDLIRSLLLATNKEDSNRLTADSEQPASCRSPADD
jgi:two-component system chemotaxis response regulator CheB